jgi:hypothetical protein
MLAVHSRACDPHRSRGSFGRGRVGASRLGAVAKKPPPRESRTDGGAPHVGFCAGAARFRSSSTLNCGSQATECG